ncbi:hypothetical protein B0181_03650 [Moraxella caviae]|uniref:Uncharacterized protein conserved in bacteria n=1 Tax=Moraxella caviae TaxID=34060 RepID=A0A1T0A6I8_9GAMM|nr:hypothetical protein [Moraxella caviae]OOR91189.1 hypothetical protein B0181_03650 [Moraxella caviae]STZ13774.1 Uncharacterized protein conserved in bacteria [Moraxella caviae]VEW12657.1 Uncharacterized protein conserved in bacteria [Moraxella caviae]
MSDLNDKSEDMTFRELAIFAMRKVNQPITPDDLWDFVLRNNLHHKLKRFDVKSNSFFGKTPEDTFCARIYENSDDFQEVPNTFPKKYILKNRFYARQGSAPPMSSTLNKSKEFAKPIQSTRLQRESVVKSVAKKSDFCKQELHPILSYLLKNNDYFQAYSKTIFHEESFKGVRGEDKWLYPDMVAVNFEYANYRKNNVLNFIRKFDKPPIKILGLY